MALARSAPQKLFGVDTVDFAGHAADPAQFGRDLVASLRDTGFVVLTRHTIDPDAIAATEAAAKDFFALPADTKSRYAMPDWHYQRGYSPLGTENAKNRRAPDLKEFWHVGRSTIPGLPGTPDVAEAPAFNTASRALFEQMDAFARTLMVAIGQTLEMSEADMRAALVNGNSILRLLHYPPLAGDPDVIEGEVQVRAAAHEDINLLTLLLGAEEAGLEVMHRSGQWMAVNPPPGAVVVNAGDMLARLTGGELPSTTHRVVNPAPERSSHSRYSMPYFLHPANDFVLKALPSCVARGATAEPPIRADDYLRERLEEIGLKTK